LIYYHAIVFIVVYFQTRKWKSFNATFAQGNALQCPGVPIEVCTRLLQNSQAGRLNKKMSFLTPPTDSTLGRDSLSSIRKLATASKDPEIYPKRMKQSLLIRATENGMIPTMLLAEMKRVNKAKVEAVLHRHEPLDCLIDPMIIAALTL
jgi:hypothetical protein